MRSIYPCNPFCYWAAFAAKLPLENERLLWIDDPFLLATNLINTAYSGHKTSIANEHMYRKYNYPGKMRLSKVPKYLSLPSLRFNYQSVDFCYSVVLEVQLCVCSSARCSPEQSALIADVNWDLPILPRLQCFAKFCCWTYSAEETFFLFEKQRKRLPTSTADIKKNILRQLDSLAETSKHLDIPGASSLWSFGGHVYIWISKAVFLSGQPRNTGWCHANHNNYISECRLASVAFQATF
jgi:hypothetical protein